MKRLKQWWAGICEFGCNLAEAIHASDSHPLAEENERLRTVLAQRENDLRLMTESREGFKQSSAEWEVKAKVTDQAFMQSHKREIEYLKEADRQSALITSMRNDMKALNITLGELQVRHDNLKKELTTANSLVDRIRDVIG